MDQSLSIKVFGVKAVIGYPRTSFNYIQVMAIPSPCSLTQTLLGPV